MVLMHCLVKCIPHHTVHLKSSTGDLLATCKQPTSEIEFTWNIMYPIASREVDFNHYGSHVYRSSIYNLNRRHDLKFAMPIVEVLEEMGIQVLVDKWDNHNKFDAEQSKSLLEKADAVWCEWALGMLSGIPMLLSACPYLSDTIQERELEYV